MGFPMHTEANGKCGVIEQIAVNGKKNDEKRFLVRLDEGTRDAFSANHLRLIGTPRQEEKVQLDESLAGLEKRYQERLEDRRQVMAATATTTVQLDDLRDLQDLRDDLQRFNACFDAWNVMWETGKPLETAIRRMLE